MRTRSASPSPQPAARIATVGAGFLILLALGVRPAPALEEQVVTIETTLADTTETFWLQIPTGYDPQAPCPLLVGWHQWGGHHLEMRNSTQFDSIADARGWIAASHQGPSTTHWNNQATQSHVVDMIAWIAERYAVDPDRIYMVGASMGGAAGMIFSNHHLDPQGPLVAAAASISGIQDCERRFHEQGINHSMIASFGGTPEEVPFEYHRNSAICFADSAESMHWNARHLPLLLSFGHGASDQVWREHAEDLFAVLDGWADTVVIRESALAGHGWGCAEEALICDFLGGFTAVREPLAVSLNLDEPGRARWIEVEPRATPAFARIEAAADLEAAHLTVTMVRNVARAALDLPAIAFPVDHGLFTIGWSVEDAGASELALAGVPQEPAAVLIDGAPYTAWFYDPEEQTLMLLGSGSARYAVLFDAAAVPPEGWAGPAPPAALTPALSLRVSLTGGIFYRLLAPGELHGQLFDPAGRLLRQVFRGERPAGSGSLELPHDLPAGVYLVRLALAGASPASAVGRVTRVR